MFSFPHVNTKAVINPGKYCTDAVHPHRPKPYSIYYNDISGTLPFEKSELCLSLWDQKTTTEFKSNSWHFKKPSDVLQLDALGTLLKHCQGLTTHDSRGSEGGERLQSKSKAHTHQRWDIPSFVDLQVKSSLKGPPGWAQSTHLIIYPSLIFDIQYCSSFLPHLQKVLWYPPLPDNIFHSILNSFT